jgi:hypothetical protein
MLKSTYRSSSVHFLRQVVKQNKNGSVTTALDQSIVTEFVPRNDDETLSERPHREPRDIHRVASSDSESSYCATTLADRATWGKYGAGLQHDIVRKAQSQAAHHKPFDYTKVKAYRELSTEVKPTEGVTTLPQAVQPMPIRPIAGTSLSIKSTVPHMDVRQRRVTTNKGLIEGLLEVAKATKLASTTSSLTQDTIQPRHMLQKGGTATKSNFLNYDEEQVTRVVNVNTNTTRPVQVDTTIPIPTDVTKEARVRERQRVTKVILHHHSTNEDVIAC